MHHVVDFVHASVLALIFLATNLTVLLLHNRGSWRMGRTDRSLVFLRGGRVGSAPGPVQRLFSNRRRIKSSVNLWLKLHVLVGDGGSRRVSSGRYVSGVTQINLARKVRERSTWIVQKL